MRQEEHDPQTDQQHEARQKHCQAMHDLVVGVVNQAMDGMQSGAGAGPGNQPVGCGRAGQGVLGTQLGFLGSAQELWLRGGSPASKMVGRGWWLTGKSI